MKFCKSYGLIHHLKAATTGKINSDQMLQFI